MFRIQFLSTITKGENVDEKYPSLPKNRKYVEQPFERHVTCLFYEGVISNHPKYNCWDPYWPSDPIFLWGIFFSLSLSFFFTFFLMRTWSRHLTGKGNFSWEITPCWCLLTTQFKASLSFILAKASGNFWL